MPHHQHYEYRVMWPTGLPTNCTYPLKTARLLRAQVAGSFIIRRPLGERSAAWERTR